MKMGQIKSQVFFALALVVFLFLSSGCVVSKKQMLKEVNSRDLQIHELRTRIADLSEELYEATSKLKRLTEKERELEKLLKEKTEWQEAKEGLMKEMGLLKEEKNNLEKRISELENQISGKEAKIKSLEENLAKIEKSGREAQEAVDKLKAENDKIAKDLADFQVSVKEEKGKLTITMLDKILFDSGKADIKKEALPTLDKLAKILKEHSDREVLIEGHTDTVPISTPLFPSNWELSTRRATTVLQYFVRDQKISPERFSAAGYGEYKPVTTNSTVEGRSNNRRVEIILLPPNLVREKEEFQ